MSATDTSNPEKAATAHATSGPRPSGRRRLPAAAALADALGGRVRRFLIPALALALLTGGAVAQSAPTLSPGGPAPAAGVKAPPPPGGPDLMMNDAGGPPPPHPGDPRGGPGGHRPPPPPPSKAAHFHFERGDVTFDVKCADDEPMKACSDLTLQLIDKLQAMPVAPVMPAAPRP